jgi:hypothetical protein
VVEPEFLGIFCVGVWVERGQLACYQPGWVGWLGRLLPDGAAWESGSRGGYAVPGKGMESLGWMVDGDGEVRRD